MLHIILTDLWNWDGKKSFSDESVHAHVIVILDERYSKQICLRYWNFRCTSTTLSQRLPERDQEEPVGEHRSRPTDPWSSAWDPSSFRRWCHSPGARTTSRWRSADRSGCPRRCESMEKNLISNVDLTHRQGRLQLRAPKKVQNTLIGIKWTNFFC